MVDFLFFYWRVIVFVKVYFDNVDVWRDFINYEVVMSVDGNFLVVFGIVEINWICEYSFFVLVIVMMFNLGWVFYIFKEGRSCFWEIVELFFYLIFEWWCYREERIGYWEVVYLDVMVVVSNYVVGWSGIKFGYD